MLEQHESDYRINLAFVSGFCLLHLHRFGNGVAEVEASIDVELEELGQEMKYFLVLYCS